MASPTYQGTTMTSRIENFKTVFPLAVDFLSSAHKDNDAINQWLYDYIVAMTIDETKPISIESDVNEFDITVDGEEFDSILILYAKLVGFAAFNHEANPFEFKFCVEINGVRHYVSIDDVSTIPGDQLMIEVWWK